MPNKRPSNSFANSAPLILIGGGLVIIVSILLWQALASTPQANPLSPAADVSIPYSNVPRVSLADARAALDNKSAVFVDVRDTEVYNADHIQGALSIPLAGFDTQYSQLDPNQWIITYCT
jgi:3-mercaptopyruvate sulfurtransferase SseA